MTTTSTLFTLAQTVSQPPSNVSTTKADSAGGTDSSVSSFGKLLTQKKQTSSAASTDTSSEKQTAATDDTTQPPGSTKSGETDELHREVAAAIAALSGLTVPVQIQTQEVQPQQTQTGTPQVVSTAVATQVPTEAGNTGGQIDQIQQLPQAATQQTADKPGPQTQENTAIQTNSTDGTVAAGPIATAQTSGQNTGQETGSNLAGHRQEDDPQIRYSDSGQSQPLFRQVETTPIKVGDTPVADTQSPQMDTQIADEIGKTLDAGAQHVEIQLTPENLGAVIIDLTRSQDGSLQVVLHTATEKAASLLTQHSAALSTLLQSNSQSDVQIRVLEQHEENLHFQQQGQNQSGNGQSGGQEHRQRRESDDFLQQLRLGLIPADEQAG